MYHRFSELPSEDTGVVDRGTLERQLSYVVRLDRSYSHHNNAALTQYSRQMTLQ